MSARPICKAEGCDLPSIGGGQGFCGTHRTRFRRHGDPLIVLTMRGKSPLERFHAMYQIAENGCWVWQRALKGGGYAAFTIKRRSYRAHVWAYEQLVGPRTPGLQLDHLCRNRRCVNPAHLEEVTAAENVRRSVRVGKTHCPQGHALTGDNLMLVTQKDGYTRRNCRECYREKARRYSRTHREQYNKRRNARRAAARLKRDRATELDARVYAEASVAPQETK